MNDGAENINTEQSGIGSSGLYLQQNVSTPESVDLHMIADHELDQLSSAEIGVLGSIGFTLLGGAFGLAVPFYSALDAFLSQDAVSGKDIFSIIAFSMTFASSAACLWIFSIAKRKNKGLKEKIRQRPKNPVQGAAS